MDFILYSIYWISCLGWKWRLMNWREDSSNSSPACRQLTGTNGGGVGRHFIMFSICSSPPLLPLFSPLNPILQGSFVCSTFSCVHSSFGKIINWSETAKGGGRRLQFGDAPPPLWKIRGARRDKRQATYSPVIFIFMSRNNHAKRRFFITKYKIPKFG